MDVAVKSLLAQLDAHPLTQQAVAYISERTPLLDDTFNKLFVQGGTFNAAYADICEVHLARLADMDRFVSHEHILDNFISATINYSVKYPMDYVRSNSFGPASFEEARKRVYDNEEVMGGYYLEGLYLALVFWHGYAHVFQFFKEKFCMRGPESGSVLEIGYGHGAYLLNFIARNANYTGLGLDISKYSKSFADELMSAMRIDTEKVTFLEGDVFAFNPGKSFNHLISCEVIEHLEHPEKFLQRCKELLADDGRFLLSTPIRSPAEDHLQFFNNKDEIAQLVTVNGWVIEHEYEEKSENPNAFSLAYVCILRKA